MGRGTERRIAAGGGRLKGVVLISGRGSNMRSIVEAGTGLDVRAVISNRPGAKGLEWAASHRIDTKVVDHKAFPTRDAFDAELARAIDGYGPDLIVLAGFMRILTNGFIARYPRRILNIHPSLLPSFPGLHTHARALEAGVKVHGATVHVVTPALDNGPIVVQGVVPVLAGDNEELLAARVLEVEHRIYPEAIRWFVEGKVDFAGDVVQVRGSSISADSLVSPRNA
jgi:phosphoribosylglycinamide formyltransferase 1